MTHPAELRNLLAAPSSKARRTSAMKPSPSGCRLLDREGFLPDVGVDVEVLLAFEDGLGGPRYRCRFCGQPITSIAARIAVDGGHGHARRNPAGIEYRIGCFHAAPGCTEEGEETEYHSWFPGHSWRIALCRGCRAHLGWAFRGGDRRFYGLIVERLVLDEGQQGAP